MIEDIHFFDKYIGTKFRLLDDEGYYSGCLYPIYLIYPDAYKFKATDDFFNEKYIFKNIIHDGKRIDYASNFGDVVIIKGFGTFHFFVFVEPGKYAHISLGGRLCYTNIDRVKNKKVTYRHKGNF